MQFQGHLYIALIGLLLASQSVDNFSVDSRLSSSKWRYQHYPSFAGTVSVPGLITEQEYGAKNPNECFKCLVWNYESPEAVQHVSVRG